VDLLWDLFTWVKANSEIDLLRSPEIKLSLNYPRRELAREEKEKSLGELGLKGKMALRVEK
jgi:hypothetical protein